MVLVFSAEMKFVYDVAKVLREGTCKELRISSLTLHGTHMVLGTASSQIRHQIVNMHAVALECFAW